MSLTREDLEYFGIEALRWDDTKETAKLFVEEFFKTSVGQQILDHGLKTKANMEAILSACQEATGNDNVSLKEFETTARQMFLAGDLQPEQKPVATAEPEVERDRLGRPLSPKAKQWKRWQEWCNDPNTDMKSIHELRRTNPEFAEFYANQSSQERTGGVGDAVENSLERPVKTKKVSADIEQFAQDYRNMRSDQLKSLLSPASVGAQAAAHYKNLYEQAIAAGLI